MGLLDRWHSWFTAFAPYNSTNPNEQIVVTVIIEASTYQVWMASAVSAIIFQGYFGKQNFEDAVKSLGFQYMVTARGQ